jgi:hypothetical protein
MPVLSIEPGEAIVYPETINLTIYAPSDVKVRYSLSLLETYESTEWKEYSPLRPAIVIDRPRDLSFHAYRDEKNVSAIRSVFYPFVLPPISADPPPSLANGVIDLTLSCSATAIDGSVRIFYTIDDTEPIEDESLEYSGPIALNRGLTIRARAFAEGWFDSEEVTFVYEITPKKVNDVIFDLPGGTYYNRQTVTLSCPTPGAEIRYTLDGSDPAIDSLLYTAPLILDADTLIRARGFDSRDPGLTDFLEPSATTVPMEYLFRKLVRVNLAPRLPLSDAEAGLMLSILPDVQDGVASGEFTGDLDYGASFSASLAHGLPMTPDGLYWYLNGAYLSQFDGEASIDLESIDMDLDLDPGNYRLSVEVVAGGFSYSTFADFRVVAP